MESRTVTIVKHPLRSVWLAIRDWLPEIALKIDDIESVQLRERTEHDDGSVTVVNLWQACPKIPAIIAAHVRPEMLRWTDRATWTAKDFRCTWQIEPHYFSGRLECHGVTRYEAALGGRGTRLTFSTEMRLVGAPSGALETTLLAVAEPFLQALIPRIFQKVAAAVSAYLNAPEQ